MKQIATFFAIGISLLLRQSAATASPSFPGVIEKELQLAKAPPCSICHANGALGMGTATTPFGLWMRDHGVSAQDTDSVKQAIQELQAVPPNGDAGGVAFIDALKAGMDPNAVSGKSIESVKYGCSAAPGRRSGAIGMALVFGLIVVATRLRPRHVQ